MRGDGLVASHQHAQHPKRLGRRLGHATKGSAVTELAIRTRSLVAELADALGDPVDRVPQFVNAPVTIFYGAA